MIHHVYANRSNIGDWLSARGIQALLRPHRVVEHLCDQPFVPQTLEKLSAAGADDLIVIGGGGLFMDYFAAFWEGMLPISRRVPTVIWGAGYCDHKRQPSQAPRKLLAEIAAECRVCIVRDELSRTLLGLDLPPPVPCPSVCAPDLTVPAEPAPAILHVDNYVVAGAEVFEAMDAAARQFAAETGRRYQRTNNRINPPSEGELARTLALYSADVILSSALHGCIVGVVLGRKVLAVSGDRKIEAFMQAAGLLDWVLDIGQADQVLERLRRIETQQLASRFVEDARRRNAAIAEAILVQAGGG
jgi:polysaccharide pyruvyl transferase WcaK-like protein